MSKSALFRRFYPDLFDISNISVCEKYRWEKSGSVINWGFYYKYMPLRLV